MYRNQFTKYKNMTVRLIEQGIRFCFMSHSADLDYVTDMIFLLTLKLSISLDKIDKFKIFVVIQDKGKRRIKSAYCFTKTHRECTALN